MPTAITHALAAIQGHSTPALAALTAFLILALMWAIILRRRDRPRADKAPRPSRRLENVLTLVAAGIASSVSASGMWKVFTAILGHSPARYALFAFIELALLVSALRARRNLLDTDSTGVDGTAVWVLASLSAVLSALDASSV